MQEAPAGPPGHTVRWLVSRLVYRAFRLEGRRLERTPEGGRRLRVTRQLCVANGDVPLPDHPVPDLDLVGFVPENLVLIARTMVRGVTRKQAGLGLGMSITTYERRLGVLRATFAGLDA